MWGLRNHRGCLNPDDNRTRGSSAYMYTVHACLAPPEILRQRAFPRASPTGKNSETDIRPGPKLRAFHSPSPPKNNPTNLIISKKSAFPDKHVTVFVKALTRKLCPPKMQQLSARSVSPTATVAKDDAPHCFPVFV